jgi:hypothetical protein
MPHDCIDFKGLRFWSSATSTAMVMHYLVQSIQSSPDIDSWLTEPLQTWNSIAHELLGIRDPCFDIYVKNEAQRTYIRSVLSELLTRFESQETVSKDELDSFNLEGPGTVFFPWDLSGTKVASLIRPFVQLLDGIEGPVPDSDNMIEKIR